MIKDRKCPAEVHRGLVAEEENVFLPLGIAAFFCLFTLIENNLQYCRIEEEENWHPEFHFPPKYTFFYSHRRKVCAAAFFHRSMKSGRMSSPPCTAKV